MGVEALVVPHRIIKVGLASSRDGARPASETVADPIGKQALRDRDGDMPAKTGDLYPGEHRYAQDVEVGDRLLHLGDPTPEIGEYINVRYVELVEIEGTLRDVSIEGVTEAGYPITLGLQPNAQVRVLNG